MSDQHFTRGSGLLENFLARKRAIKANNLIPKNLEKGKILDIGCGSYPYFLTRTNFTQKFGVDPSLITLNAKGIILKKHDVTSRPLPFANNYFDVVTMLAVFEHIEDSKIDFVLKEILRVLRVGGLLIMTTPSPWSDKILHIISLFSLISAEEIHDHKHHYSRSTIEKAIEKAGFEKDYIEDGFFELSFNMWFKAQK